ncbi:hypothetical protein AB0E78_15590 [Streptomyces sp. NPDC032198]|uniref:hypothetical protein n=1 Tax=Streptomyces sp. NPDC032198 TaxID=3155127 RepID=UPI0033C95D92
MTSNQAGSVALLLVGVVLLVMAINGSPLTRARYQDYELLMAPRRRQVVETIEGDSPEEARQALQVLRTIDPGASRDPAVAHFSGLVLEREVASRLRLLYPSTVHLDGPLDGGVDLLVRTDHGAIGIEVKSGETPLSGIDLRRMVDRVARSRSTYAGVSVDAILMVTNRPLPVSLDRRVRELNSIMPTAVVRWVDEQDDQALEMKIQELSDQLNPSE